jgi:anti-anti-sigma factor
MARPTKSFCPRSYLLNTVGTLQAKTATISQPDAGMRVTVRASAGNCVLAVSGRITIDSAPDLRTFLLQHLALPNCESLTLDFSDIVYVDTSALAVVLEALKAAGRLKKAFHLSGLRERPRYLFEATRLLHLFDQVAK